MFNERSEALRRRILKPLPFRLFLLAKLPLALWAGLRLERLDAQECVVALPGGWRTRNPFGSTYFAAQAMAAEMSTGGPALILTEGAEGSLALILVELRAVFSKRIVGESRFRFSELAAMKAAIERAAAQDEPVSYTARSVGLGADGAPVAQFDVTWSFKRRAARS